MPTSLLQGPVPKVIFGHRSWDELSIADQDKFLLACMEDKWSEAATELDLKWFTAQSISIPFTAIYQAGEIYGPAANTEKFVKSLRRLAGRILAERTERAIARRNGIEFDDAEPVLEFVPPSMEDDRGKAKENFGHSPTWPPARHVNLPMDKPNPVLPFFIAAGLLFLALIPGLPYGFFQLLRILIFGASCYGVLVFVSEEKKAIIWLFISIAVLFNPWIKIRFDREIWQVIDVVVGLVFVFAGITAGRERVKKAKAN